MMLTTSKHSLIEPATTQASNPSDSERSIAGPRFSIITSTFNAADLLPLTARSLAQQTCRNFEWIVVDGASTDGTVAVVRSFDNLVTEFISEPDSGISDAWNKALQRVSGQWILFLGAGDIIFAPDVLQKVSDALDQLLPEITTVYGDVTVFDSSTDADIRVRSHVFEGLDGPWGAGRPRLPCHQGTFQNARVFEGFTFDHRCRISIDNEPLLRELLAGRGIKVDLMVARFESGGVSTLPSNRLRMVTESIYINWKLGIFHKRPIYQLTVLGINAIAHPFRRRG